MIRDLTGVARLPEHPTIEQLRNQLQLAIEIEHTTIPAYLTALFSIQDGTNSDVSWVLRTIAVEEMLHMTLAANVLNAIGGHPAIGHAEFVPDYPFTLPFVDPPTLQVEALSPAALFTFIQVERNWDPDGPPPPGDYATIGEFYEDLLAKLLAYADANPATTFTGDPSLQICPEDYYGSEGRIIPVKDPATATDAIRLIVDQGEGTGPPPADVTGYFAATPAGSRGGEEHYVAHLYRFAEAYYGRYYNEEQSPHTPPNVENVNALVQADTDEAEAVELKIPDDFPKPEGPALAVDYGAVWPIRTNPKAAHFPVGSGIREKLDAFNVAYSKMLAILHNSFNGNPSLLKDTVPAMYELRYLGEQLSRTPSGDGVTTVGPSWELVSGS